MRGFLSRVQRRVSGGGNSDTTPAPPAPSPQETKDLDLSSPSSSSKESNQKSNSSKGIESTPRADVVLPKKHKRLVAEYPHPIV